MVAVGELLASVALKAVFSKLVNLTFNATWTEIARQLNFSEDYRSIKDKLSFIQSFLKDAERQSSKLESVLHTLKQLKAAAYDLEDMLLLFESCTTAHEGEGLRKTKKDLLLSFQKLKMPSKMKRMREAIEGIIDLQNKFNFIQHTSNNDEEETIRKRETISDAVEVPVGRMEEKERIISKLQTDDSNCLIVFVSGFAGVGKTTLAQMVFNDDRMRQFFEIQAWVYVSVKFDIMTIAQSIITQLDKSNSPACSTLQATRDRLKTIVEGKQFLIVLDDVWEEDPHELEKLRALLRGARTDCKIIATTRSVKVAKLMNVSFTVELGALPDNCCWELLRAKAFPDGKVDVDKESIGRQIVKKCRGMPLAAISLGYLCRKTNGWKAILDSDIWAENADDGRLLKDTKVLPSLKLSYQYMSHHLKLCFAYCAVFPKGWYIEKSSLIQQWIALGFIQFHGESFNAQQAGERYFEDLREMSFLQDVAGMSPNPLARYSKPQGVLFQMHDLVRELARLVAGDEVVAFDTRKQNPPTNIDNCRYMLLSNLCDSSPSYWSIPSTARALHFNKCSIGQTKSLMRAEFLRVLDLSACTISDLPASIGSLRLLKFLNVSGMQTGLLPKSLSSLRGLQALNLSENTCLVELPSYISEFINLQYLDLHGCSNLKELPQDIHKLEELLHLNVSRCGSLPSLPEKVGVLRKLSFLDLSYCSHLQTLPSNFGGLQSLSFLNLLQCYELHGLPDSFIYLANMIHLNMSFCRKLKLLPNGLFKYMKKLLVLNLSGCTSLEVLPEFCNIDAGCRMLEILELSDCTNLADLPDSCTSLWALRCLNLSGCSRIQNFLKLIPHWKLGKLEYLNLSGVGANAYSEAPGTSAGNAESSEDHNKELELGMLQEDIITQHLVHLRYLSVGGFTLFSEQGIARLVDLLTLPNFDIRTQPGDNHSNIMLLQQILDLTQHELNIKCLENVVSPEEAKQVELGRKQQLHFLSLEWSSFDIGSSDEHERRAKANAVLEHLRPHKNLQCLSIKGYNGGGFPKWIKRISDTLPYLVKIVFSELNGCVHIPTLGHLPNLQELEINNMPCLYHVEIVSCKKLRKLTLVKLPGNATIKIFYDDNTQAQVNEVGLIHNSDEEEIKTGKDIEKLPSLPVSIQGKRKAAAAKILVNANRFMKASRHNMSRETKRTQDIGPGNHSSAVTSRLALPPGSSNERREQPAVLVLDYLKIQSCKELNFLPYVPVCKEYFIMDSSPGLGLDDSDSLSCDNVTNYQQYVHGMLHWISTFKSKFCINRCSLDDFVHWMRVTNINMDELITVANVLEQLEFCGRGYCYGQKFHSGTLQKLKITNCGSSLIRRLLLRFTPIQELELDGFLIDTRLESELDDLSAKKKLDDFYSHLKPTLLCITTGLEKLTIPSLQLAPEEETNHIIQKLSDRRDIPYINIREAIWFSVQTTNKCSSSNIAVLFEGYHPQIKRLVIKNLENVKGSEEVREGDICRHYHELESLSLMWSSSEHSDPTVQDNPRIANDVAVLEKLRPPPCLLTLCIEGYWHSSVCSWMMSLSSVLPNLVRIELAMCEQLPPLGQLEHLNILTISHCCNLVTLPQIIRGCRFLKELEILECWNLAELPEWLGELTSLTTLIILTISHCCNLVTLPQIIRGCRSLKELEILECWNLAELPEWLGELTSLTTLIIHAAKLEHLPRSIQCLTSLKKLVLKKCNSKLREWCNSEQNSDIIQHVANSGCLDTSEGLEVSISSSSDIAHLEKTTSHQLIELNIKDLQHLSILKAEKINLVGKEELQLLILEWSSKCDKIDDVALEKLRPHQNLRRLFIKNYPIDFGFPHWMHSLPNLVSMELSNVQDGHLHLDHLQSLQDLHVSSFYSCVEVLDYDRSLIRITSVQPHKRLRRVTMARVGKLVWESSCLPSENLFPGLEYLEIDCCWDVRFEPSIPRSARYIISGSEMLTKTWLFRCPTFKQVMGLSTSAPSKLEIKYIGKLYSEQSLDSLRQLDCEELTVDTCSNPVPLPEGIRAWKSLRKLEILNCENIETLPEWLGDMASLRELKVETHWAMKTLPPCIGRLTSLQTLALLKCTKKFKQRCSEGGDDWSKIKHIDNLIIEEMRR